MPQLEGLRAVAVVPVLYQHWTPIPVPIGGWGVLLFFVISGYLITGSLLQLKEAQFSLGAAARFFFLRRIVRLCPAYYALLAIALATIPGAVRDWPWLVSYTSNILMALDPAFRGVALTATWSLAVEEQFYLLWFVIVIGLRPAWVLRVIAGSIILAIAFRAIGAHEDRILLAALMPAAVDALALGAALCFAEQRSVQLPRAAGPVAAALLALSVAWTLTDGRSAGYQAMVPFLVSCAAAFAVWRSRTGFGGAAGYLLSSLPVRLVGRVSYGVYLYHMITPELHRIVPGLWRFGFAGHFVATLAVAATSYYVMEAPLLRGIRARSFRSVSV